MQIFGPFNNVVIDTSRSNPIRTRGGYDFPRINALLTIKRLPEREQQDQQPEEDQEEQGGDENEEDSGFDGSNIAERSDPTDAIV